MNKIKVKIVDIRGKEYTPTDELFDGGGKLIIDLGFGANPKFSVYLDGDVLTIDPFDKDIWKT